MSKEIVVQLVLICSTQKQCAKVLLNCTSPIDLKYLIEIAFIETLLTMFLEELRVLNIWDLRQVFSQLKDPVSFLLNCHLSQNVER